MYVSLCAMMLLLERVVATSRPAQYEHSRPWLYFWLCQPICLLLSAGIAALKYVPWFSAGNRHTYALLIMMFFIISLLVMLFSCNKYMTRKVAGRGMTLGLRYQLAENIKALKIIIPIIVCDSLITVFDIGVEQFFGASRTFDMSRCANTPYLYEFICCQLIRFIIQFAIPIWTCYSHPSLRKFFKKNHNVSGDEHEGKRRVIKNVLGSNIGDTQQKETYTAVLNRIWIQTNVIQQNE
ncbi:hypothetical protein NECAME_11182 [Necator americanus]|uniref:Sre G protein-coupled chemoreceptor n=1 Tax=Necator americanus TaxID=51031 RepID=W2T6J9_NECAM|nr:hypothetical protein NECAME_11182 [Necator americanus]ETN77249.1 hypothetical protein NECAME_11182 [Necator americanus]